MGNMRMFFKISTFFMVFIQNESGHMRTTRKYFAESCIIVISFIYAFKYVRVVPMCPMLKVRKLSQKFLISTKFA